MRSQDNHKVFVVGIDGAPFSLVHRWAGENKLPTVKKLMQRGAYGVLRSAIPPLSVPAWPCLLTGRNPGTLGVFGFVERNGESYELKPISLRWNRWSPVWALVGARNKRVILVNVPTVSAPPSGAEGVFVTGPLMHRSSAKLAYPPDLNEFLVREGYDLGASFLPLGHEQYLQHSLDLIQQRHKVMIKLLAEEPWDFFMGVFFRPDPLKHRFWKYMDRDHPKYRKSEYSDVILRYYQQLDRYLSDFLSCLADDTYFVVVSDHGHGPLHSQVDLNAWLHQEGFLTLRNERRAILNRRALASRLGVFQSDLSAFASWLASFPGLSKVVEKAKRMIPPEARQAEDVDWARTKAYSFGTGVIYLNLSGREPLGCVESTEYEEVRNTIIERLYTLHDSLGTRIVQRVWTREELYPNASAGRAPDIFIEFTGQSHYVNFNGSLAPGDTLFPPGLHSSAHTREGLILASGPDIKCGEEIAPCRITDVVPTLLHIMDIPIPDDLDGQVIREIFQGPLALREPAFESSRGKAESATGYTREEEGQILERLRKLGYLT